MYFGNHSRRDIESNWFGTTEADVDDVGHDGDVGEVNTDKDLDPDSGDATVDSDSDGLNLPELEFTMNGSKNDDDEVEEDDDDDVEYEDDIQMDEEDCEDELEPQFKKKKTK